MNGIKYTMEKRDIEFKLNDELKYCSSDFKTIALAIYYLAKTIEEKKGAKNESNNDNK